MTTDDAEVATDCWPEVGSPDVGEAAPPASHPAARRVLGGLMVASVFGGLGQLTALTVTGLLIEDLTGSRTWIGTGNAVMQVGTAGGAYVLSHTMAERGRRIGLVAGYVIGLVGGVVTGFGAKWGSYPVVLLGLLLFGAAVTASLQARFAAADVVPDRLRARGVGLVVWSTTIGVVFGPKLSEPAGDLMERFGFPELGGPYVVGGLVFGISALTCWFVLRPDPMEISRVLRPRPRSMGAPPRVDVRACLRRPAVRLAIVTLVLGQVVMVAIMSITSVHLRGHGYSLGGVGTVISGHVFGMYAPSPVSGWLSDRLGRVTVIAGGGLAMTIASLLAATARPENHAAMIGALFLLGVGWNANFVAGSTLVTEAVTSSERPRVQGIADTATFLASAAAALLGGVGLSAAGYPAMAVAGAAIAGTSAIVVLALRQMTTRSIGSAAVPEAATTSG